MPKIPEFFRSRAKPLTFEFWSPSRNVKLIRVVQDDQGGVCRLDYVVPGDFETTPAERGWGAEWCRQFFPGMTWDTAYGLLWSGFSGEVKCPHPKRGK